MVQADSWGESQMIEFTMDQGVLSVVWMEIVFTMDRVVL
jgi:hypothetical protein